jgi:ACS family hexuronate transporter-like MFS transporter
MSSSPTPPRTFGFRWTICGLLFFATTINYLDRQVLSILAPKLQGEFGWTEVDYGNIVFAFQLAYALAMIGAGRVVDIFGTRLGYPLFVATWSLASMAHALAGSVLGFGVARFALGITEAGNFPAAIKTVAEWFPKKERALATGIFNSGSLVGAVGAPLVIPWIALAFGWQAAFIILGATGFVWVVLWWMLYTRPEQKRGIDPAELALITGDAPDGEPKEKIPWARLLRYRGVWAFVAGKFFSDPIWWFFLFWLPKFLNKEHGLDLAGMGLPLVVIYSVSAIGSIGGGWITGRLMSSGWSLNAARKTVMLVAALAVVPVFFAASAPNLWVVVGLISLATAAHCAWMANLFSLVSDIYPTQVVASVTGIGGFAGSVGGMLIAIFTGWLLQTTGAYWPIFLTAALSYVVAWVIIALLVPKIEPLPLN